MAENDAVYRGTGKRKTSVARVILTPGSGAFTVNGRALDEYFGRPTLRTTATSPLELTGLRSGESPVDLAVEQTFAVVHLANFALPERRDGLGRMRHGGEMQLGHGSALRRGRA